MPEKPEKSNKSGKSNEPKQPSAPGAAERPGARLGLRHWWNQRGPGRRAAPSEPSSAADVPDRPGAQTSVSEMLAERELALSGIREGIIAVNAQGVLTRMNETARLLLGLPLFAAGSRLGRFGLDSGTVGVLSSHGTVDRDRAIMAAGRMLVINQVTVRPRRGSSETVTTLQDRTELVTLRLPGTNAPGPMQLPSPSNQTVEFSHRLHTIEAIIGLGDTSDAFIHAICIEDRGALTAVMDPAVAALLAARTSLAAERGAHLQLVPESTLPRLDPATSSDVATVLGLLLDNALDSVAGSPVRRVTVTLECIAAGPTAPLAARLTEVRVGVHDTGPGIAGSLINNVFEVEHIATTPVRQRADSGGLDTVQRIAGRRGGAVSYHHEDGVSFEARLPVRAVGADRAPSSS